MQATIRMRRKEHFTELEAAAGVVDFDFILEYLCDMGLKLPLSDPFRAGNEFRDYVHGQGIGPVAGIDLPDLIPEGQESFQAQDIGGET